MNSASRAPRAVGSLILALGAFLLAGCGGGGGDDGEARVRLLNLSTGYTALDMLSNLDAEDDDEDVTHATGVALEAVSSYAELKADDYTIKLRRTGSASTLRSFADEELVEESVYTYVAYGEVGRFSAFRIDDTADEADAGKAKLSVVNISSAGFLDFYLTEPNVDLDDTTPTLYSVDSGLTGATLASGTYRLRATAAGDTADVRLDLPNFTLSDKSVGTLIFTSTPGGTLANAFYLPQGGQPTKLANTKARIRGAVGLAGGTNATIRAGGQTILTNAASGVISSRYTVLDSGAVPVTLSVNGTAVPVDNQQLRAGDDYTLLVWTSAAGTQVSLITDDNRLPMSAGSVKIRLLNGMSTLNVPLTLSLDFSPIVEMTPLGEVSDEVEVTAGSDRQIDVSNSITATNVWTRTGLVLQGNTVYTYFMTDMGSAPIGILRKDR